MEAMASGTPVVTTDCIGIRDYAINNVNALIVPPGNTEALSEALYRVLTDEALRRYLIENGLQTAREWSWNKRIELVERFLLRESSE